MGNESRERRRKINARFFSVGSCIKAIYLMQTLDIGSLSFSGGGGGKSCCCERDLFFVFTFVWEMHFLGETLVWDHFLLLRGGKGEGRAGLGHTQKKMLLSPSPSLFPPTVSFFLRNSLFSPGFPSSQKYFALKRRTSRI